MNSRYLSTIVILLTLIFSQSANSQTCKVSNGKMENGMQQFTEVYEFDYVDIKPEFPGGGNSLIDFINSTREYPAEAYKNGIQGRVTCSFIVHPDGKISHIKVLRGVETSLNNEAVRIISEMPLWTPGIYQGTAVPVRVVCCIPFRK